MVEVPEGDRCVDSDRESQTDGLAGYFQTPPQAFVDRAQRRIEGETELSFPEGDFAFSRGVHRTKSAGRRSLSCFQVRRGAAGRSRRDL